MIVTRIKVSSDEPVPLMCALPYQITLKNHAEAKILYDPQTQLTDFDSGDFSTCTVDESVWGLFHSQADTKKDD